MMTSVFQNLFFAATNSCTVGNFLIFPTWYKYLSADVANGVCSPKIENINDVWLIVAAIIEIMLRVAAIAAVAYIIYGAVNYVISQGEPDKTKQARMTIINALVGLIVAILATAIVSFLAGSVK